MKKLISIGVALALLAMVVVPTAVAAQCDYDGVEPATYAKIPFTIIGTGFMLMEEILDTLATAGLLPSSVDWLPDLMLPIGEWTMGPLAWTVDMLAWGIGLVGLVLEEVDPVLTALGIDLGGLEIAPVADLVNCVACALYTPFSCNITGAAWNPCT